jgi:outer membrane protein OmpA-like peptidoglycan-associated protein
MRLFLLLSLTIIHSSLCAQGLPDSLLPIAATMVYFDFAREEVSDEGVDSIRLLLRRVPPGADTLWIDVQAHTDAIGSHIANRRLAERRAARVADALVEWGWPHKRIRISGAGKTQPVADNDTEEGRQANRRAEVRLMRWRPMATVRGLVVDPISSKPLRAPVYIEGKTWSDTTISDENGRFAFRLPRGEVVRIGVNATGFFPTENRYRIANAELDVEVRAQKLSKGAIAEVDNLFFVGNRAVLLPDSEPTLPRILHFMEINPTLKIEIAGHVNVPNKPPMDETTAHYTLSVARAKLVYDYLVEKGVSPERMTFRGYANWEMRFPKAYTEREQAQNRRVEIRVLDME